MYSTYSRTHNCPVRKFASFYTHCFRWSPPGAQNVFHSTRRHKPRKERGAQRLQYVLMISLRFCLPAHKQTAPLVLFLLKRKAPNASHPQPRRKTASKNAAVTARENWCFSCFVCRKNRATSAKVLFTEARICIKMSVRISAASFTYAWGEKEKCTMHTLRSLNRNSFISIYIFQTLCNIIVK